jgi:hypothetical protein
MKAKPQNTLTPKHPQEPKAERMANWWKNAKVLHSKKDKAGTFNMELYLNYLKVNQQNYGAI